MLFCNERDATEEEREEDTLGSSDIKLGTLNPGVSAGLGFPTVLAEGGEIVGVGAMSVLAIFEPELSVLPVLAVEAAKDGVKFSPKKEVALESRGKAAECFEIDCRPLAIDEEEVVELLVDEEPEVKAKFLEAEGLLAIKPGLPPRFDDEEMLRREVEGPGVYEDNPGRRKSMGMSSNVVFICKIEAELFLELLLWYEAEPGKYKEEDGDDKLFNPPPIVAGGTKVVDEE